MDVVRFNDGYKRLQMEFPQGGGGGGWGGGRQTFYFLYRNSGLVERPDY